MRRMTMTALVLSALASQLGAQARPALAKELQEFVSVSAPVVALIHVQVLDGTGAPAQMDQTILLRDGRIAAIGPSSSLTIPAEATRMDLTGHTVIPGIAGLHDHTFYTTGAGRRSQLNFSAPRLYLGSGVTTIRTTGSITPYAEISIKAQVEKGTAIGPRMFISGPYITGPDQVVERIHVTTPEDARRVVKYWYEEGATWFKLYTMITRREAAAAIQEAHRLGVKVTGHLCSIGFKEAADLGIDAVEHGLASNLEYVSGKVVDVCPSLDIKAYGALDVNGPEVQSTFRALIDKHVAMTSTLAVYELSLPNRPPLDQRMLDAMSPDVRDEVLTSRARIAGNPRGADWVVLFKKAQEYEVAFVKAGGLLAAGVDPTGNGGALPGFGDQRNFELLVEAGFTPVQAMQVMTLNGAKVLGIDDKLGSVTVGKIADLVVIKGDPAAHPVDIRNVVTVFKDGVGYDSAKLLASVKGLVGVR